VDTVTGEDGSGLPGCSGDQLLGVISGARRQQARDEWIMLSAVAEFARRAGTDMAGEFAADELAFELHLSQPSAAGQMAYATAVTTRLPELSAALGAGQIQPFQLRMIEEETRYLSDADAATADAALARAAPGMTFGQTRGAARKLALTLDPDLARKRKDAARRDAHVRRFQEESGNAGMVARELPADEVLASWQHVEQRAQDLRAAGIPGTLQELRVRAYLDLLQERDTRTAPGSRDPAAAGADASGEDQPTPDQPTPDQPPPASDPSGADQATSGQPGSGQAPPGRRPARLTRCRRRAWRTPSPGRQRPAGRRTWRQRRAGRSRQPGPRASSGSGCRAEPGRAGHHHHPAGHLPRPVRRSRGGRRVRPGGR